MRRFYFVITVLSLFLLAAIVFSLCIGSSDSTVKDVLNVIIGNSDDIKKGIILKIRLPRILLAAIVGSALAVAGVAFQALLRNPLAEPYILGVSGGAGFGAVMAIALGISASVSVCAFLGALFTVILIYYLATSGGKIFVQSLLLLGVILNAIYAAIITFISSLIDPFKIHNVSNWLMGNIGIVEYNIIAVIGVFILFGIIALFFITKNLNLMSVGEETAQTLGIDIEKTKNLVFILSSLIVGIAVSQTGLIAFVGFIVPHIFRLIIGPDNRLLLPASAIAGAIFLVLSDTIARTIVPATEIPVGVITIALGGPIFVWLLLSRERKALLQ